jgi:hypothetical protein
VTLTFSAEKSKGDKLKEMMRKDGQPIIRAKLAEYIRLLKEEFSEGLILPTKDSPNKSDQRSLATKMSKMNLAPSISSLPTSEKKSEAIELREVKIQDRFQCSRTDLFRTFCDLERVKAFTKNSVSVYDCKQGGFFSIFSDNITGRFLKVTPYERLEMLWRFKSWPADHYSHVALTFHEETDRTKLVIQQTGVPSQYYDNTMVRVTRGLRYSSIDFFVSRKDGNASIWKVSNQRSATDLDCSESTDFHCIFHGLKEILLSDGPSSHSSTDRKDKCLPLKLLASLVRR